jgi:antitoxin (DNA-binding transcriptional repressor) of toxin-antitoxin stability system
MKTVNTHYAKTHLSELIDRVLAGEDIVITRYDRPMVRLTVVHPEGETRIFGQDRGRWCVPDDFNRPMSEEELAVWYGESE